MVTSLYSRGLVLVSVILALSACEQLGHRRPRKVAAAREAEGKAVGSACRHAQRAIEDCYTLNPKAQKSAVFAGWKEMDEYMRENKLEPIAPVVPRPERKPKPTDEEHAPASKEGTEAKEAPKEAPKSAKPSGH